MQNNLRGFGRMLLSLRNSRHLTQQQLGQLVGVHEKEVQRWEVGRIEPELLPLDALITVLNLHRDQRRQLLYYLGYTENPVIPPVNIQDKHLFGLFLRRLRWWNLYVQQEVADMLGVDRRTYARWELGKTLPDPDTITSLIDILRLSSVQFHALRVLAGYGPPKVPEGRFRQNLKAFGNTLRQIRQYKGWLQEQLAAELPVDDRTLRRWELGTNKPSYQDFIRLDQVLAFTDEEFMYLKDLLGYGRPVVPEGDVQPNLREFGRVLLQFRLSEGLEQDELGRRIGVDRKTIRRWEQGQNYPRPRQLEALGRELNLDKLELWYLQILSFQP